MEENEHYGTIPGTKKAGLWKSGAEKLSMMFRLVPKYKIERIDMENGHRENVVICTLIHSATGEFMGEGVGSCSTMESKYRYRSSSEFEILDEPIPGDAKENKIKYRRQGFGMKKTDAGWVWVEYKGDEKQENPDIADVYNTVLKMAKKRAHIDAVLTATAASDIFTQDYDDSMTEPEQPRSKVTPINEWFVNFESCQTLDDLKKAVVQFNMFKNQYTVAEGIQIEKKKDEVKASLMPKERHQDTDPDTVKDVTEERTIQEQADEDQARHYEETEGIEIKPDW